MRNKFDYETMALHNEIMALKAWNVKVAEQLRTKEYVVPVTFTLEDRGAGLVSSEAVWITVKPQKQDLNGMLVSCTIDINDLENRAIWGTGGITDTDGIYKFEYFIQKSENAGDAIGSVINYNVVITTTALVNISVEYEAL